MQSALIAILTSSAHGVDVTYTDRTTFENALGAGRMTESFEPFSIGIKSSLTTNDFSVAPVSTSNGDQLGVSSGYLSGGQPTDGNQWLWQNGAIIYQFSKPTKVFGADFIDWGDGNGSALNIQLDSRATFNIANAPRADLNYLFFGVISDTPFTSVSVISTSNNDLFSTDKLNYTIEAVPESSTYLMAIISSTILLLRYQNKKRD